MESRREAYETCAHLTLEVDRMAPEAIAEAIETYLPGAHG